MLKYNGGVYSQCPLELTCKGELVHGCCYARCVCALGLTCKGELMCWQVSGVCVQMFASGSVYSEAIAVCLITSG